MYLLVGSQTSLHGDEVQPLISWIKAGLFQSQKHQKAWKEYGSYVHGHRCSKEGTNAWLEDPKAVSYFNVRQSWSVSTQIRFTAAPCWGTHMLTERSVSFKGVNQALVAASC